VETRSLKKCSKCGEEKSLSEFRFRKDQNRYVSICKQCACKQQKIERKSNKYKFYLKDKKYRETHKKEIILIKSKWYKENKQRIFKNRTLKRLENINFRLAENLRSNLNKSIKRNTKSGHTLELLGCNIDFLKYYLELQFKPGMTWNNYGKGCNGKGMKEWHVDHIKPRVSFDLSKESEQNKCFHYSNLQPLWATENFRKNKYVI